MFKKLKDKLDSFKEAISSTIDRKAADVGVEEAPKNDKDAKEGKKKAGVVKRAKTLIVERELILDENDLEGPLWDLEMALLESDVALPVAESIINTVKDELVGVHKKIRADTGGIVETALRNALIGVMSKEMFDLDDFIANATKPVTIVFTGVNGTGKTTTIAKVASRLKAAGYSVVIASGDTFQGGRNRADGETCRENRCKTYQAPAWRRSSRGRL